MLRNPLHAFTAVRDTLRYTTRLHRLVVNLVTDEEQALRSVYPHLRPPTVVIGNGVDVERFQPPTDDERHSARAQLGLAPDDFAVAFVGHEYDRKGLPRVIEALAGTPDSIRLVVAGGTPDMVARLHTEAADHGLAGRVIALGAVTDPRPVFHASDVFCLPSAYESFGLVYLEALACGLPVVASRTGCVPDVIVNGSNGFVTSREPDAIREALMAIRGADRAAMAVAAREAAMEHSWEQVARGYLQVLTRQPFPSIRERHR